MSSSCSRAAPTGQQEAGSRLGAFRGVLQACLTEGAVLVEQGGQRQLRSVLGQAINVDLDHRALGESTLDVADILLEPPHNNLIAVFRCHRYATTEALWVEDFEQRRKAVRVPVVWGRRQK